MRAVRMVRPVSISAQKILLQRHTKCDGVIAVDSLGLEFRKN